MMSRYNYLPLEIQQQIMKWLPVKSLIRFRSVSKTWKSYIDSAGFVASYSSNKQHIWVKYYDEEIREERYLSIVDDDTFTLNRVNLTLPPFPEYIGCSDGLLCFYLVSTAFFWNPSIRRGFHVDVPIVTDGYLHDVVLGFGVCRETNDLKVVKITCVENELELEEEEEEEEEEAEVYKVDVWTLSTRAWRSLPANAILSKLYFFNQGHAGRLIAMGGVVYWLARRDSTFECMIISFDITTEELGEVDLPDILANSLYLTMSKLRESLVVLQTVEEPNRMVHNLWMMEGGVPNSFTKIFTCDAIPSVVSLVGLGREAIL